MTNSERLPDKANSQRGKNRSCPGLYVLDEVEVSEEVAREFYEGLDPEVRILLGIDKLDPQAKARRERRMDLLRKKWEGELYPEEETEQPAPKPQKPAEKSPEKLPPGLEVLDPIDTTTEEYQQLKKEFIGGMSFFARHFLGYTERSPQDEERRRKRLALALGKRRSNRKLKTS